MDDKELLRILEETGLLSKKLAEEVARSAELRNKSVEEVVYERGLVDEERIAKIKSAAYKIPYKEVMPGELDVELIKSMPGDMISQYLVVPISATKDSLVMGVVYPAREDVVEALRLLEKQQKKRILMYLTTPSIVQAALKKRSSFQEQIQAAVKAMTAIKTDDRRIVKLEPELAVAEEAPIIKLVSMMLKEATEGGASDLHIEPQRESVRLRLRIEGDLHEIAELPIQLHKPIISRIKVLSNLKLDETRIPQDGRFRTIMLGREIDFRVATFPTPFGEKVALRVLDSKVGLKTLDELGLSGRNEKVTREEMKKPYGMILITGPTGSGKTTTLYAMMQILNREEVNVVSLEDPVEYSIEGVNQSQVKPEIGYTFATGLRQILRQDPNIIMVGEIRDQETAELAIHAALTGHIVLSTLHTNNSVSAIPRLLDLGVQPFLLPTALNLMMAQRLVPKLCQACKEEIKASPLMAEVIEKEMAGMPEEAKKKYPSPYKVYRAKGCSQCNGKGVEGRIAIFEAFRMTPELAKIIDEGINEEKLWNEANRQNLITLRQDGVLKALQGLISIEAVVHATEELL